MQQKRPAKIYQPPSLLHLATQVAASNLEKFPPGAIGVALSEYHWDAVVKARVAMKKESKSNMPTSGMDTRFFSPSASEKTSDDGEEKESSASGSGSKKEGSKKEGTKRKKTLIALDGHSSKKMLPALAEKFLTLIEKHPNNAHLSKSKTADELLWRSIVDYHFSGTMSRPRSLEVPCGVLKERLKGWSDKLLETVACPLSEGEYIAEFQPAQEEDCQKDDEEEEDGMAGDETADDDQRKEKEAKRNKDNRAAYQQYLGMQSNQRTNSLRHILHSFQQSPMDVTLLAETEVGKSASKVIKVLKKFWKQVKEEDDERKILEVLGGYPRFLKPVDWGQDPLQKRRMLLNDSEESLMTPLEILQQILQDWKDMASQNGVEMVSASAPPNKRRKIEKTTAIATCGKDKRQSSDQHQIDMTLLHSSPDWRSLCKSLRERESDMRKSHGDKVRSIRDGLKNNRAQVGKCTLKKAVGRVRGSGGNHGINLKDPAMSAVYVGQSLTGQASRQARRTEVRREAILSKVNGNRARQQQQKKLSSQQSSSRGGGAGGSGGAVGGGGGGGRGKMSQIRNETKAAASLYKSSMGSRKSPAPIWRASAGAPASGFGASVASAGGITKNRPKGPQAQLHVQLKNGRRMSMPASSSASEASKTVGVFSSLQKKKQKQVQAQGGPKQSVAKKIGNSWRKK